MSQNSICSSEFTIIDSHIHPAFDAETDFGWYQSAGDLHAQVAALKRAGISRACGAPICRLTPTDFQPLVRLNDLALSMRDKFPDFYVPGIQINPRFPQESCREIERCCGREGVRWIGEIVGYVMGFQNEYATDNALLVFKHAQQFGAAVNFHCDDLEVIEALCQALPELPLVLAHPSASKVDFLKRIALVAKYANLHLDISGSGVDRLGIVRKAVELAGRHKILFGTDYPINNPAVYVAAMMYESLTREDYQAIFSGNFLRLTQHAKS